MALRSPSTLTSVAAGLVLLAGLASAAGGAADTPAAQLALSSGGSLELSNSLSGAAVFRAHNMAPGSSAGGTVSVSNTGGLDGAFSLSQADVEDAPGPFGGRLSDHFQLAVEELSAGGSTAQSLYSGVLSGLSTRQLGRIRAGETRIYRFTVNFPDTGVPPAPSLGDNLFQSASLSVDYVWAASSEDSGAGGGGDGSGSGSDSGQASLTLRLAGKRVQRPLRRRRLVVQAKCSHACRLTPSARVNKARGVGKLRASKTTASAAKSRRLIFKLSRKKARALDRVLRRRKRAVAVAKVTAAAGVKVTARRRIVVKR